MTHKYFTAFFSLLLFVELYAGSPLNFPGAESAYTGIYIEHLATGKVETDYNSSQAFVPASVMKCVTSATAQVALPADFRFRTTVEPIGKINGSVLEGDLLVCGGADPTLGSRHFPDQPGFGSEVVKYLKQLGVDSITGDIIVDDSCLPAIGTSPYWLQEDIAWEYGAGLFGINFRDNSFSLTVKPGIEVVSDQVEVVNRLRRGTKGEVIAMRAFDSSVLTLSGTVTGASYTSRYSMPSPAFSLYNSLLREFKRAGIACQGVPADAAGSAAAPFVYQSPLRDEILHSLMVHSNNLFAEGMLRATVLGNGSGERDFADAIAAETDLWRTRGINMSGCRWLDGCGLAPVQRITPRTLAGVLAFMAKSTRGDNYVALFPKAGVEGTVRSLLAKTPLAGRMALKSGSMNSVVCYAGYMLDANSRPTHTVVIMVNGFSCPASAVRKAISVYLQNRFCP